MLQLVQQHRLQRLQLWAADYPGGEIMKAK